MDPCDGQKKATFDYSRLSQSFSGLSKPAQRALINNAIFSVEDLSNWTRRDVARLHGIGPSVLPRLDHMLGAIGLSFK